jgi:hypothetical protein
MLNGLYTLWSYTRFGPNVKFLLFILSPVPIALYPLVILCASIIASVCIGFLYPFGATFFRYEDGMDAIEVAYKFSRDNMWNYNAEFSEAMRRTRSARLVPGEKPWDLNLSMVPIGLIMAVLGSMNSIVHFMSVFFSPAKSVFIVRNCRGNPRQRGHSHSEADPGIIKSWYLSLGHANYVPAEKISIRYHCIDLYCHTNTDAVFYCCCFPFFLLGFVLAPAGVVLVF